MKVFYIKDSNLTGKKKRYTYTNLKVSGRILPTKEFYVITRFKDLT